MLDTCIRLCSVHEGTEDGQNAGPVAQYHGGEGGLYSVPAYWCPNAQSSLGAAYGSVGNPNAYPLNCLAVNLPQIAPLVKDCLPRRLQSFTASGMQVVMMDGSVRSVAPGISGQTWGRVVVPNDGLVLGNDW